MDIEWEVEVLPSAQHELDKLPDAIREEILEEILELGEDPFPVGSIPLHRHQDLHRIRAYRDRYRVVYQVSKKRKRVIIRRIRQRSLIYRGL